MRVRLEVIDGPELGRKVSFSSGQIVKIGRTDWSDVAFSADPRISSQHFALSLDEATCRLVDLESRNGTYLNKERINDTIVNNGDEIMAGHTRWRVEIIGSASVIPAMPAIPATTVEPQPAPQTSSSGDTKNGLKISPQPAPNAESDSIPAMESHEETLRETVPDVDPVLKNKTHLASRDLPEPYKSSLVDESIAVRSAAINAAAWRREKWLLDYCRRLAKSPSVNDLAALRLLAVLGEPSDLRRFRKLGHIASLGSIRFELMGRYGHPGVVQDLLVACQSDDEEGAAMAKNAFFRLTGMEIFEADDPDLLPDEHQISLKKAWGWWERAEEKFQSGTRWAQGINISCRDLQPEWLDLLTMDAVRDCVLRTRYFSAWENPLSDLTAFPLTIQIQ